MTRLRAGRPAGASQRLADGPGGPAAPRPSAHRVVKCHTALSVAPPLPSSAITFQ